MEHIRNLLLIVIFRAFVGTNASIQPNMSKTPINTESLSDSNWMFSKPRCGRVMPAPTAQFYLFTNTSSSKNEGKVIKYMDMKSVNESGYHVEGTWKVLIHGFLQHKDAFFPRAVKDAYLTRMITHPNKKYNVLVVDWGNKNCSSLTNRVSELLNYNTHADCTTNVALQLAHMLEFLLTTKVINSTKYIHLIGFSLGAHVAGQAGRNVTDLTGHKIARITGLDPAQPWWNIVPKHHKDLSQLDADFVDVFNTSSLLGSERRFGHVDFYFNGGSDQPGCIPNPVDLIIKDFLQICSHNAAVDIFAKSILDNSMKGCACGSKSYWNYLKYLIGWCTCEDQATVGEFINPSLSGGEYFVSTPYEEVNWRKYMKTLNSSELARSDSRILSILEVLCIV